VLRWLCLELAIYPSMHISLMASPLHDVLHCCTTTSEAGPETDHEHAALAAKNGTQKTIDSERERVDNVSQESSLGVCSCVTRAIAAHGLS
jgi:hypothetical protein